MSIRNAANMVNAGRFLELSVPTTQIRESLEFYLRLGFTEIPTNDIRVREYAAVSDGKIVIGLHGNRMDEPSLTFVQPDVARSVQQLADMGTDTAFQRLGGETFNEAGVTGPDGHLLAMIEARTFSQSDLRDIPDTLIGRYASVVLRSDDVERATVFWEAAGFTLENESDEVRKLVGSGLTLLLDEFERAPEPMLRYEPGNFEQILSDITAADIDTRQTSAGRLIRAPEGTRISLKPTEEKWKDGE